MDCSLPGSSVHGIFQARVLEWGAVAFSKNTRVAAISFLITFCMNYIMVQDSYIGGV